MDGYTVAHFEADVGPVDGGGWGWGERRHFGCLYSILGMVEEDGLMMEIEV